MKTLEQQAVEKGGTVKVDFSAGEPDSEWCPIMVTPAVVEKLEEIGARLKKPGGQVLVEAIQAYDEATREKT